ncbi:18676_t:CDS:1, partial [Racocetra persica]
ISLPIALTKFLSETFVKLVLNQDISIETVLKINTTNVVNTVILVLIALLPLSSWITKYTDMDVPPM